MSDSLREAIDVYSIPGCREPFSSYTHLIGAIVFAILTPWLLARARGNRGAVAAIAVFCFSCVLLLALSSVYHMLWQGGVARPVMKRLDVAAIFLLIAGTFTPIHVILFRGVARWGPLLVIWTIAITGIVLRTIYFNTTPPWIGLAVFLMLGWLGALGGIVLARRVDFAFVKLLLWGGLAYTIGAVCLGLHWPTLVRGVIGPHEVWHVAVLLGIAYHWGFIWQISDGRARVLISDNTCLSSESLQEMMPT